MTRTLASFGLIAGLALAAIGCNTTSEGAEGLVLFTPDRCDLVGSGCSFADDIAVGGTVNVWIGGNDGVSTAGFELESDDASVFTVVPISDIGGRPTWEITGTGPGVAHLYAVDGDGADVDFIEVVVQELDGLHMLQTLGQAVGPTSDADYDEIWQVNAGEETWFYVEPLIGNDRIMGVMQYDVTIDSALDSYLAEGSDVPGGFYKINAPAGDYWVSITADNGTPLDVLFQVQ